MSGRSLASLPVMNRTTPLVMGVLNATPDSFYEESRISGGAAVDRGIAMVEAGADWIDIGGESSRPGANPVDTDLEISRILPVVDGLAGRARISIDTIKVEVATAAVAAGATLINDVSGDLAPVAADLGVGWVAMHAQGMPATMQDAPHYDDVVAEVSAWLEAKGTEARALGVTDLWLDPGIGFGKTFDHNWTLLRHADELAELARGLGARLLLGTSRKRFLGDAGGPGLAPSERLAASLATALAAMEAGAAMVRVHDVTATVQAARVFAEEVVVR